MYLNRIITIIEKEQILVVNVFLDHEWVDSRLKWNPIEYNNISLLRVLGDLMWVPDTFIDTVADHSGFIVPSNTAVKTKMQNGYNMVSI